MNPHVKICGITTADTLKASCDAGARFIGFVFYPSSPRNIAPHDAADLIRQIPSGIRAVGLFVDPTDEQLDMTLSTATLDMIQLHGSESHDRVTEIKSHFHLPIIKAFRVKSESDIDHARTYEDSADWLSIKHNKAKRYRHIQRSRKHTRSQRRCENSVIYPSNKEPKSVLKIKLA